MAIDLFSQKPERAALEELLAKDKDVRAKGKALDEANAAYAAAAAPYAENRERQEKVEAQITELEDGIERARAADLAHRVSGDGEPVDFAEVIRDEQELARVRETLPHIRQRAIKLQSERQVAQDRLRSARSAWHVARGNAITAHALTAKEPAARVADLIWTGGWEYVRAGVFDFFSDGSMPPPITSQGVREVPYPFQQMLEAQAPRDLLAPEDSEDDPA